ncbi:GntR family transcriptional regulator [Streptomyces harbinensis]|uniref:GntR family transcriptional regulator n=1 Tax=Streptomyces harbinensis TaxID=1176198 RepID=UPI0036928EE3
MPAASPRGTYLRVADAIREDIDRTPAMVALPPVSQLMTKHGVSRSLVNRALNHLKSEGLVRSAQGAGWYVVGRSDPHDSSKAEHPLTPRLRAIFAEDSLTVGSAFPSESALRDRLGTSRPTVRLALGDLEKEGLLERVPGKARIVRALPTNRP